MHDLVQAVHLTNNPRHHSGDIGTFRPYISVRSKTPLPQKIQLVCRTSPSNSEKVDTITISAQDEFENFTSQKRTETRTILPERPEASTSKIDVETPASSSKTAEKKERKGAQKTQPFEFGKAMGTNIEMDTGV